MTREERVFLEAGCIAQEVGFIAQGVFRVCYFDRASAEITTYFLEENNFVVNPQSYRYRLPSTKYVQAVTEAQAPSSYTPNLTLRYDFVAIWELLNSFHPYSPTNLLRVYVSKKASTAIIFPLSPNLSFQAYSFR